MERHVGGRIIPRLADHRFQRKGNHRHNGEKYREDDQKNGDRPVRPTKLHKGSLPALAGDGGKRLPLSRKALIDPKDQAAQHNGNEGDNISLPLIPRLDQCAHLGGECKHPHCRPQEDRHRIAGKPGRKNQQEGGQDRRHDDRDRNPSDDRSPPRLENGGAFFQCGIHIFQDAPNEQIGKGRIVQPDDNDHGEQAEHKPFRHADAKQRFHHTHNASTDFAVLKHIRPEQGERPGRHHVGKNENGRDKLFALQIRAGNEPGNRPSHKDPQHTGACSHDQRILQRDPEIHAAPFIPGKQLLKVMERPGADRQPQHFFLRSRMDGKHVHQHRHHGEKRKHDQRDQCNQQYNIGRFGKKGP